MNSVPATIPPSRTAGPTSVVSGAPDPGTDCAPEFSVVMPCLNEARTLDACIGKALNCLRQLGVSGEVVIADNGSDDGSPAVAARAGARVVNVGARGYGSALAGGIAAAGGRYVIMGDADDSYDFANLGPFIDKLRDGYALVVGNRFLGGIRPGAMPPLHRYVGNPVLSGIGRLLFRSPCRDFHCGLRAFDRAAITRLDLRTTGMEFASEMIVKAALHGLRVAEVPTTLSPDGRGRAPHLRSFRDGWRHLRFLLLYSPKWLFFYPGLLLMLVGTAAGLWLLPGPRQVGGVTLDVHTLMYAAAAVLVGAQAVAFAVFTKVFAVTEGLLAPNPRLDRLLRLVSLESGLTTGLLLVAAGLIGSVSAVGAWGQRSFGPLEPSIAMRVIVPSITMLTLGCQLVPGGFFLSVLRLGRR
jgi:hypothetical protein